MGMFKRRRREAERQAASTIAADPNPRKSFGHAAFDRADIDDARRGFPANSLQSFATANHLEYRGQEIDDRFISTLPLWPDYVFNVCRGAFPGGRLGQVGHELLEVAAAEGSIRTGGTFYDVKVTTRRSLRDMANLGGGDPENAPFAENAVWIPTTVVHVRAPELNQLPEFTIARTGESLFGGANLERHGLPGFRLQRGPKGNDTLLAAVGAACRPTLTSRQDTYVQLRVKYGIVALTVNGYRVDDEDLLRLVRATADLAEDLVALTRPATTTPFTTPGPAARSLLVPDGIPLPHPDYSSAYPRVAGDLGLHDEDRYYLCQLLPRCPIPGIASGVMFGTLPGTDIVGRLAWFEHGGKYSRTIRAAAIVPAASGASTSLGGVTHEPTGMQVEVVDGIAYCWKIERYTGRLESRRLGPDAQLALATSGIAVG